MSGPPPRAAKSTKAEFRHFAFVPRAIQCKLRQNGPASETYHASSCGGPSRIRKYLLSELVGDTDLEIMLHQRQLIRDGQRAVRGGTTNTSSGICKAEGSETAERGIPEV